jgi:hypothetical protein
MRKDREQRREDAHESEKADDQARLAELEDEIAAADPVIKRLERERDLPVSKAGTASGRALKRAGFDPSSKKALGAPALLRLTRCFDGTFPRNQFEQLVERIRELTHEPGVVEITDDGVVWGSSTERHPSQAHLLVRVTVDAECGRTVLVTTDRLGALVGRLFGAFGTIFGAGGLAAPVAASIAFPWFTPVFVFGWLGGVFGSTRLIYRRLAAGRAQQLQQIFGALVLEIEPYLQKRDDHE